MLPGWNTKAFLVLRELHGLFPLILDWYFIVYRWVVPLHLHTVQYSAEDSRGPIENLQSSLPPATVFFSRGPPGKHESPTLPGLPGPSLHTGRSPASPPCAEAGTLSLQTAVPIQGSPGQLHVPVASSGAA